ncbi:hypothetical protein E0485_02000 [Paenibacillus albiflavus]|uniref:Saccharopine dehydrogenase NADP binding domain-containing protein n=1 Tax=Paenibacillus albiflavus TaxID=2545760 RepID=A0A4R4ERL0_9BACL|nr:saccharopine dehydrogenase NADP-binding domain-containing protein [Paenibacillus albiflavus]TCZ81078.1 hypothetical protein E0485_02000 [Paenibacillus albiflavus]
MRKDILIIGGYGDVGKYVVEELNLLTSTNLVIGGRSEKKALQFINDNRYSISFLPLDIYEITSYQGKLDNIGLVIMCLSPRDISFAEYCMKKKIHYIDISPSNQILGDLFRLNSEYQRRNTICILGVGITPGLSTLLAKEICKQIEIPTQTDISLMLGLGEEHGSDGIKWLLNNLEHDFYWNQNNKNSRIVPFMNRRITFFPSAIKKRSTFSFNLADQQIITKTLLHNNVSTYLCYNSKTFTWLVHFFKKFRFFRLLKYPMIHSMIFSVTQFLLNITKLFLSDTYAIQVDVSGISNNIMMHRSGSIIGRNNPRLTGKIIAYTAFQVTNGLNRNGVYYLSELFNLADFEKQYGKLFSITYN